MGNGCLWVAAVFLLLKSVGFAQTNSLHLAIVPFYSPAGDRELESTAATMPDLLITALSSDGRFQLVEREKINAIWSEWHLAEAGLTSADTVGRLGTVLACDWLVSGSLVRTKSGPQVWIKVIDTRDGVVLDLQPFAFNPANLSAPASDVAAFLTRVDPHSPPREYVALEDFRDLSVSPTREDLTPRLSALIEKQLLAAGYGVIERDSVAPIFSEYQLQSAGMTAASAGQVRLKPAFWVISGNWKWFYDSENKLSATLTIKRMGAGEQVITVTQPPGTKFENSLADSIRSALKNASSFTGEQAQAGEEKLRTGHLQDLIKGHGDFSLPSRFDTNVTIITVTNSEGQTRQYTVDPVWLAQSDYHQREMLKTLQQAILLNPKDMYSKYVLGICLLGSSNAVESKQGQDLLDEVAKSGNPVNGPKAEAWLNGNSNGPAITPGANSNPEYVAWIKGLESASSSRFETNTTTVDPVLQEQREHHRQEFLKALQKAILADPKDMHSKFLLGISLLGSANAVDSKQGYDLLMEVVRSADPVYRSKAEAWLDEEDKGKLLIQRDRLGNVETVIHGTNPSPEYVARTKAMFAKVNEITNIAERSDSVVQIPPPPPTGRLVGIRAVKLWQDKVLIASGTNLSSYDLFSETRSAVKLPVQLRNFITAIEADDHDLWLGTAGDGLIRIPKSGSAPAIFGEKDGFPMPNISALRLIGDRLFIGFGAGQRGAFGYLDSATGKFTGLMGPAPRQTWNDIVKNPPSAAISSITTADGTNFWVCSTLAMQYLDLNTREWSLAVPRKFEVVNSLDDNLITINSSYLAMIPMGTSDCLAIRRFPSQAWTGVNLGTNSDDNYVEAIAADHDHPSFLWLGGSHGRVKVLDTATSQIVGECKLPSLGMVHWILESRDNVIFIASAGISGVFDLYRLKKSDLARAGLGVPSSNSGEKARGEINQVVTRSEHPLRPDNLAFAADLDIGGITAYGLGRYLGKGPLLVASGTILESYDWSGVFGFGSGVDLERIDLPVNIEHTITAIACDQSNLWLGTDGGGLIQFPQSGAAPRVFNKNDGFPNPSIRSLALVPERKRLFIGFGQRKEGAFGYLDTESLKFTEPVSGSVPRSPVGQIKTDDKNTFWIASVQGLFCFKLDSGQCTQVLPSSEVPDYWGTGRLRTLSVSSNYVAAIVPSDGVAWYNLSENHWTHMSLSTNREANCATTLAIDSYEPNHLWVGSYGKVTVLDMNDGTIIGEFYTVSRPGAVDLIVIYTGDVFAIGDEMNWGYSLFHMPKPEPQSDLK